jgi:murein DD-endopeptidase
VAGAGAARLARALLGVVTISLAACAGVPQRPAPPPPDLGATIAGIATSLVGRPYHFGGADTAGFDCSGLALYVHERIGLTLPRTAREQQLAARPVPLAAIAPGDLVFFRIRSRRVNHVGIYVGEGRFVHAPRAGQPVAYGELDDRYYRRHLVGAGRFWGPVLPP